MQAQVNFDDPEKREFSDTERLIDVFNQTFSERYQTRLVRGDDEPVYLPADKMCHFHRVVFAHGFFASALHEIAHWCLAGERRRQLVDYGYWYCPDGRDAIQQRDFERVEVKPQAIEKALSLASARHFDVSTDNLNGAQPDRDGFRQKVDNQYIHYCRENFPSRVYDIADKLAEHFGGLSIAQQIQAVIHDK